MPPGSGNGGAPLFMGEPALGGGKGGGKGMPRPPAENAMYCQSQIKQIM